METNESRPIRHFAETAKLGATFARALVFKRRVPLVVGWNLTYQCNLNCLYCGTHRKKIKPAGTEKILTYIDQLAAAGTQFITFGGGEPLLRNDLDRLIHRAKSNGIHTGVKTNGTLVCSQLEKIKEADEVEISLDGRPAVHDQIRGVGVGKKAIAAIDLCKRSGMAVTLNTVISKKNVTKLAELLNLAKEYQVAVSFQPIDSSLSLQHPDLEPLMPIAENYTAAIEYLIAQKKNNSPYIGNSVSGLRYLMNWPHARPIRCLMQRTFCNIEPDCSLGICDNHPNYWHSLKPAGRNIALTFSRLESPGQCNRCWGGTRIDFNLLGSFKPDAWVAMWSRVRQNLVSNE